MTGRLKSAFFAYAAEPRHIGFSVEAACRAVSSPAKHLAIKPWSVMEVFGASIPDEVRAAIEAADIFFCDITVPNLNVYYEIGYAIGTGKLVGPFVNIAHKDAEKNINKDSLFDNIGYKRYENAEQLAQALVHLPNTELLELYERPINHQQPIFILDTYRKTDFRNAIVSALKASKVFSRSFDPVEVPRLSTVSTIADVTSSSGVIVPFLGPTIQDFERHNLRGAFVAGLSYGLGRDTLLVQMHDPEKPPTDYGNNIAFVRDQGRIVELVSEFSKAALLATQSISPRNKTSKRSDLQKLTLGASAAENEFSVLGEYFVETAEYTCALRGEAHVVAGRKGSGKTAIFFQARDKFCHTRQTLVTDLRPESHQLSLFREELLKVAKLGVFDHTLAAFWYQLILSELLLSIRRESASRSRFDPNAFEQSVRLATLLQRHSVAETGDFTGRINGLVKDVIAEIRKLEKQGQAVTAKHLTNFVFQGAIAKLKTALIEKSGRFTKIVLLFDNIDKGWPVTGVDEFDVRLIRLLIETLDKIKRDLSAAGREFLSIVFLRNDIYELMVSQTPDRGKSGQIVIDWTDRAKLRQLIFERIKSSTGRQETFEVLWSRFFCERAGNRPSFDYLVDHCLMRPRFLINIIEKAIANGVNRGHKQVQEDDCADAVRHHALDLVSDFGYEIRDVSGLPEDLLYAFVGVTELLTYPEILACLQKACVQEDRIELALKLLLWYGILGIATRDGIAKYIYDYDYNYKRLVAEVDFFDSDRLYVVNAALHVALKN